MYLYNNNNNNRSVNQWIELKIKQWYQNNVKDNGDNGPHGGVAAIYLVELIPQRVTNDFKSFVETHRTYPLVMDTPSNTLIINPTTITLFNNITIIELNDVCVCV